MSDSTGEAREEREKFRAYPNTILEFYGGDGGDGGASPALRVDLRAPIGGETRAALVRLGLDGPFAVFTAENPEGANAEDAASPREEARREAANERRHAALEGALREARLVFRRVDGTAPDGDYRERCVAVRLSRDEATALATRLRQLALFWYDGEAFWLLPADADQPAQRLP